MREFGPSQADRNGRRRVFKSVASFGLALGSGVAFGAPESDIARSAESIHQEFAFAAPCRRVYATLTDEAAFQKVEELSDAMDGLDLRSHPARISRVPGGAFSLFGDHIVGRQIELVPDQRIVQAWRVSSWAPGIFSIARFQMTPAGQGTSLVFDHIGFPAGTADHLASGWHAHYWEPMKKFFA